MSTSIKPLRPPAFTILEIVIALTVLTSGILIAISYLPVTLDSAQRSLDITRAVLVAQNRFAEIRAAGFNAIAAVDAFNGVVVNPAPGYPGFTTTVTVMTPDPHVRELVVTVRWQHKGRIFEEVFSTVLGKYNPG